MVGMTAAEGARAQSPDLLLSLSQDDATVNETVRDEDVVRHAPGMDAHVAWPAETLALLAGDGGNPLHDMPTDVDAVHDAGGPTAGEGLLFSTPTNWAGFLDGDVLGFGVGGIEVVLAEADIAQAVGSVDGNVDVDAIHRDADGTWIFSLADNEASTTLSGDDPGTIKDGAVLSWAPGASTAAVLHTESQMDAMVTKALGASTTVTDTLGLSRDPVSGALLFCVQSPTANDASVFTMDAGGALLPGHEEADHGFTGSPELDALSVAVSRFPVLTVSNGRPQAGETLVLGLRDAEPGRPHVVLVAFDMVPPALALGGWGGFVLAQDTMLAVTLSAAPLLAVVPDAMGSASMVSVLPDAVLPVDVVLQAVAPGSGPVGSNPVLLELAQ
ncbi:MAG: hypothetical protein ACYTCU_08315 [Planctomycetota bacterium]